MHLICSKTRLTDGISMVQKAISTRSTLPILEGIFIDTDTQLTLTGYDLETGIECKIDTEIREKGSIVVNARIFGEIIRKLPEEMVTIKTTDDLSISIKSGKASFQIRGLEAGDYPKIPIVEESQKVSVPQAVLKRMINQTIFATSNDESRPVLNGIKVSTDQQMLELVAIDGFRLAVRKEEIEGKNEAMSFIVPAKAMAEVARILEDSDDPVAIYPSHNHILFETETVRLVSRLIQGDFMEYRNIVPASCKTKVELQSRDMLEAIERASLVINVEQRRFPVTLNNENRNELMISAKTDLGHVEELIPIDLNGDDIDINFNPKYFMDVMKCLEDQKLSLEFSGHSAPCLVKPLEGENFLYLILPLRR